MSELSDSSYLDPGTYNLNVSYTHFIPFNPPSDSEVYNALIDQGLDQIGNVSVSGGLLSVSGDSIQIDILPGNYITAGLLRTAVFNAYNSFMTVTDIQVSAVSIGTMPSWLSSLLNPLVPSGSQAVSLVAIAIIAVVALVVAIKLREEI